MRLVNAPKKKNKQTNKLTERLLSVVDGEAKHTITSIGRNCFFYAAAFMTLRRNLGNPQPVTFSK